MTHLACFFHLSVRVCQQDVITFALSTFEQPVTHHPARHKNNPTRRVEHRQHPDITTSRLYLSTSTPKHDSPAPAYSFAPPFPFSATTTPNKDCNTSPKPRIRYAIMSDLCYNCATCHLTAGPCLRDLVQCEICYSWGHLYIFCPRSVTIKDRAYRYWGKCRTSFLKR